MYLGGKWLLPKDELHREAFTLPTAPQALKCVMGWEQTCSLTSSKANTGDGNFSDIKLDDEFWKSSLKLWSGLTLLLAGSFIPLSSHFEGNNLNYSFFWGEERKKVLCHTATDSCFRARKWRQHCLCDQVFISAWLIETKRRHTQMFDT